MNKLTNLANISFLMFSTLGALLLFCLYYFDLYFLTTIIFLEEFAVFGSFIFGMMVIIYLVIIRLYGFTNEFLGIVAIGIGLLNFSLLSFTELIDQRSNLPSLMTLFGGLMVLAVYLFKAIKRSITIRVMIELSLSVVLCIWMAESLFVIALLSSLP